MPSSKIEESHNRKSIFWYRLNHKKGTLPQEKKIPKTKQNKNICKGCVHVVWLFVCLRVVFAQTENIELIWRRHHWRWRAAKDLCSAPTAFWGKECFIVPRLLWHGPRPFRSYPKGRRSKSNRLLRQESSTCDLF